LNINGEGVLQKEELLSLSIEALHVRYDEERRALQGLPILLMLLVGSSQVLVLPLRSTTELSKAE
jgi:hypothetical protein